MYKKSEKIKKIMSNKTDEFLTELKFATDYVDEFNTYTERDFPQRELVYLSSKILVMKHWITENKGIFIVENLEGEIVHQSFIGDEKLESSHLMNLINREEQK